MWYLNHWKFWIKELIFLCQCILGPCWMDFLFKCFIFRRNDLDLTQSNVFHLTKNILLSSDELSQGCLSKILSLNVWQTFYLPVLGLKVASHFKQTAISQSFASFLSNILTKFCQNSDFDSICHSVFSDLANQNGKILFLEKTINLLQSWHCNQMNQFRIESFTN
jgi:hypothetical protein